jgi:hypothetical protein
LPWHSIFGRARRRHDGIAFAWQPKARSFDMLSASTHSTVAKAQVASRTTRDRFVDAGFHVSVALLGAAILAVAAIALF